MYFALAVADKNSSIFNRVEGEHRIELIDLDDKVLYGVLTSDKSKDTILEDAGWADSEKETDVMMAFILNEVNSALVDDRPVNIYYDYFDAVSVNIDELTDYEFDITLFQLNYAFKKLMSDSAFMDFIDECRRNGAV